MKLITPNSKRDVLIFGLLLIVCALTAHGQSFGPYSLTGSQCAAVSVDSKATVALQVTGTWTGTLQPEIAIAGQAAANTQVVPSNSTTKQSTITANGAYVGNVAGGSVFLLCGATVASGTATVYLNVSPFIH